MKLTEAIQQVKREKPHSFSEDHCTVFINEVESMIQEFLGIPKNERIKYDWERDGNKALIVREPYSVLYISFLKAKIDYVSEEYESYANNQAQFVSDFDEFKAWAIRTDKVRKTLPSCIKNWW